MKIAIIGAGFTGLLAGYLLEKKGHKVTIYEKEELIGGHCRTIVRKDQYLEVGTVFSFSQHIKELLVELNIDYSERFTYRNFLDENLKRVEHLSSSQISNLLLELKELQIIMESYTLSTNQLTYGYVHEDLLLPLSDFLSKHHCPSCNS